MILPIALSVVAVVVSFFLWAALHELAHAAVLKSYRPQAEINFKLYPHRELGCFFWARVNWEFDGEDITQRELAWVSASPRLPDLIGAFTAPALAWLLPWAWQWQLPVLIVAAGSLVDLAVGSIGYNHNSDLMRVSRGWQTNSWALRIIGWLVVLHSGAATVLGLLI